MTAGSLSPPIQDSFIKTLSHSFDNLQIQDTRHVLSRNEYIFPDVTLKLAVPGHGSLCELTINSSFPVFCIFQMLF